MRPSGRGGRQYFDESDRAVFRQGALQPLEGDREHVYSLHARPPHEMRGDYPSSSRRGEYYADSRRFSERSEQVPPSLPPFTGRFSPANEEVPLLRAAPSTSRYPMLPRSALQPLGRPPTSRLHAADRDRQIDYSHSPPQHSPPFRPQELQQARQFLTTDQRSFALPATRQQGSALFHDEYRSSPKLEGAYSAPRPEDFGPVSAMRSAQPVARYAQDPHYIHGPSGFLEGPGGAGDAGGKRFRISRACQHCKTRKTRCDAVGALAHQVHPDRSAAVGNVERGARQESPGIMEQSADDSGPSKAPDMVVVQPCTNCLRANVECVYSRKQLKRGPSKGYVKQLEKRLDTLEHSLLEKGSIDPNKPIESGSQKGPEQKATKPEERLANLEHLVESEAERSAESEIKHEDDRAQLPDFLRQRYPSHAFKDSIRGTSEATELRSDLLASAIHKSLPLFTSESLTTYFTENPDMSFRRRSIALLLEPLNSLGKCSLDVGSGKKMTLSTVVGKAAMSLRPVPMHTSVLTPELAFQRQIDIARASAQQVECLLVCYIAGLRRGYVSLPLIASAVTHQIHYKEQVCDHNTPASGSDLRREVALFILDRFNAAATSVAPQYTTNNGDPLWSLSKYEIIARYTSELEDNTSMDDLWPPVEILRFAMVLDEHRKELAQSENTDKTLSDVIMSRLIRRVGLDNERSADTKLRGDQELSAARLTLRNVLYVHGHILQPLSVVDKHFGVDDLEWHIRPVHEIIGVLRVDDRGKVFAVLVQSFLGPLFLAILAFSLDWSTRALAGIAQAAKRGNKTISADEARLLEHTRSTLLSHTNLLTDLALDAHGARDNQALLYIPQPLTTGECSFAVLCARVALFCKNTAELNKTLGSLEMFNDEKQVDSDSSIWKEIDYAEQADALARAVKSNGPLAYISMATDKSAAWHLWTQHHERNVSTRVERDHVESPSI